VQRDGELSGEHGGEVQADPGAVGAPVIDDTNEQEGRRDDEGDRRKVQEIGDIAKGARC